MKKILLLLTLLVPLNVLAGTVQFTADAPTMRSDNTTPIGLSELKNFEAACSKTTGDYTLFSAMTANPIVLTGNMWTLDSVLPGTYYCAAYAYDIDGRKSNPSPEFSFVMPVPIPGAPVNIIINIVAENVSIIVK